MSEEACMTPAELADLCRLLADLLDADDKQAAAVAYQLRQALLAISINKARLRLKANKYNERLKERNVEAALNARNHYQEWASWELELLATNATAAELAPRLGRSIKAVKNRRYRMRGGNQ